MPRQNLVPVLTDGLDPNKSYVMLFSSRDHVDWDAALTLGAILVVVGIMAYPAIRTIYDRLRSGPRGKLNPWNVLLGAMLMFWIPIGIVCGVTLMGYWAGQILHILHIPQGVLFDQTRQHLVPWNG